MPPKKATPTAKKAATSAHASYQDMIKEAVINLKEKGGSSRQAIKKYVLANNDLKGVSEAVFTTQINKAIKKGSETGVFNRPKGDSGPVKLGGPKTGESKPAVKKAPTKAAATKKAPAKKATATKKKAPAKKATTKAKAPAKARKTAVAAPAVEDKPPVVLGKTKSGRVTKTKAPVPEKKAAPKKRKAPAKKATPKKA